MNVKLNIQRDRPEDLQDINKLDKLMRIGLLLVITFVPLILGLKNQEFISPNITDSIFETGIKGDLFSSYKYIALIVFTIILALVFLFKLISTGYELPNSKLLLFIAFLYSTLALSIVFSSNKYLALNGMFDRKEGAIAYFCYITLFVIASNIRFSNNYLRVIIYTLSVFILINTFLSLYNFLGYDIIQNNFVGNLLFPEGTSIKEGSRILSTLSHGNYLSGISAVFVIIFACIFFLGNTKEKIISGILTTASFVTLLCTLASSGFVSLVLIIPFFVIFLISKTGIKRFVIHSLLLIIALLSVYYPMAMKNPVVWDESLGFFLDGNPFQKENISFRQPEMQTIYALQHKAKGIFQELVYGETANASKGSDFFPQLPEHGVALGTGRLWIWEKTIEMIGERPIFGYGLDTFPYHFNQDDPQKHANLAEGFSVIVDKPHNMYLGLTYGAGILAGLSLLSIILIALFQFTRDTFTKDNEINIYLFSISLGIITYCIQGLFNDSTIGAAVFFWVFLGLMVSKNNLIEDESK
jgi:hypothetical protein